MVHQRSSPSPHKSGELTANNRSIRLTRLFAGWINESRYYRPDVKLYKLRPPGSDFFRVSYITGTSQGLKHSPHSVLPRLLSSQLLLFPSRIYSQGCISIIKLDVIGEFHVSMGRMKLPPWLLNLPKRTTTNLQSTKTTHSRRNFA